MKQLMNNMPNKIKHIHIFWDVNHNVRILPIVSKTYSNVLPLEIQ